MEQRDYLKKQIDQLALMLAKLLTGLAGFKNNTDLSIKIEETKQNLKDELDIDLDGLICLTDLELVKYIQYKNLSFESIDRLADIMALISTSPLEVCSLINRKNMLQSSLFLFQYLEKHEVDFSYERHLKIGRLLKKINE